MVRTALKAPFRLTQPVCNHFNRDMVVGKKQQVEYMLRTGIFIGILLMVIGNMPGNTYAEQSVQLATINWEPYTGENLPNHGFFSEIVTEAFSRTGCRVEFKYFPWSRALLYAKKGVVHGLMVAYWKRDRVEFLNYSDVVWKVKEEFIALRETPIVFDGALNSLKGRTIGALRGSAQAEELKAAGLQIDEISDQVLNIKKLLKKRIDIILIPSRILLFHLDRIDPTFDTARIKILKPEYKIFDMYVVFSKQIPGYEQLTADFNMGLDQIKNDGTYRMILHKHDIEVER